MLMESVTFISTAKCLIFEGYLEENAVEHGFGATVCLSRKGNDWLERYRSAPIGNLHVMPIREMLDEEKTKNIKISIR